MVRHGDNSYTHLTSTALHCTALRLHTLTHRASREPEGLGTQSTHTDRQVLQLSTCFPLLCSVCTTGRPKVCGSVVRGPPPGHSWNCTTEVRGRGPRGGPEFWSLRGAGGGVDAAAHGRAHGFGRNEVQVLVVRNLVQVVAVLQELLIQVRVNLG